MNSRPEDPNKPLGAILCFHMVPGLSPATPTVRISWVAGTVTWSGQGLLLLPVCITTLKSAGTWSRESGSLNIQLEVNVGTNSTPDRGYVLTRLGATEPILSGTTQLIVRIALTETPAVAAPIRYSLN